MSLPNKIFIAYEIGHLAEAERQAANGSAVICLDFIVERECEKRGLSFISWRHLVNYEVDEEKWWVLTHDIAREWYRLPAMSFFAYDGIRIAEAPEPMVEAYLARLFYYARILLALKKQYPNADFYVPTPNATDESNPVCLASFVPWAVIDAARLVGLSSVIAAKHIPLKAYIFPPTSWKWLFLRVYNAFMGFVPRRRFKIYASEYWLHFAPVVPYLKDTELILLESKKLMDIPWRQLFAHRIRAFYHRHAINHTEQRLAKKIGEGFVKQWINSKKDIAAYLASVRGDLDWNPVLEAFEYLVMYAPQVVADIESLCRIMKKEKPDVVLQMASVGGPDHYFLLMARVAAKLKIPSLELQHATVTIDPRSVYCRIETDYLATYGTHINEWHERLGHARDRLISVGSPRFDQYVNDYAQGFKKGRQIFTQLGLDTTRPILLVAVPFSDAYVSTIDSYQLNDLFRTIQVVQNRVGGLQIFFKCRNARFVDVMKQYIKELFTADWTISGSGDIFPLLCASDAVVCNNSTVIYQAVLAGKPLILYPWKHFDSYHAQLYSPFIPLMYDANEAADVLAKIFTDESYRQELLKNQKRFLEKYSFDGQSSSRVAALLCELPKMYQKRNRP